MTTLGDHHTCVEARKFPIQLSSTTRHPAIVRRPFRKRDELATAVLDDASVQVIIAFRLSPEA